MLVFLWGAFLKMVIADRIAQFVNPIYHAPQQFHGYYLLLAVLLYSLQIYADFAGYSMMALGIACAFGFDLPDNFRQPYLEGDIAGFWRCWHISLTSWFRDYLYIPLGGNRKGKARKYLNILIVFLVSGFWHGAGITFLVWGTLHAVYQIAGEATRTRRERMYDRLGVDRDVFSFRLGRRIVTYLLVSVAWVFFRAETVGQALTVLWRMLRLDNPWILFDSTLNGFGIGGLEGTVLLLSLLTLLLVSVLQRHGIDFDWFDRQGSIFQGLVLLGLLFAVMVYGIYGPEYDAASFIYAAF